MTSNVFVCVDVSLNGQIFKCFFLLYDKHNYTDLAYLVYLILLNFFFSCPDQPSSGREWIHKKSTVCIKVLYSNYNNYNSENGIISNMKLVYRLCY